MVIVLDISYYGDEFCGFAKQPNKLTIQGNIEDALYVIFQKYIDTTCAGRTDSGVHAKHQFVSFKIDNELLNEKSERHILRSLNGLTHEDIHINKVEFKIQDFSARFDAKLRKYSYFISNQEQPPIFMKSTSLHISKKLDIELMKEASNYLIGEHDFKSFCVAASAKDKPTKRNITSIEIENYNIFDENIIEIKVAGNAFLHSMVRTLVGTLIKVGTSKQQPHWVKEVLDKKNRQAAGECVSAKGLVLMDVLY